RSGSSPCASPRWRRRPPSCACGSRSFWKRRRSSAARSTIC
ncbi:MAG: hypothetical protein AVDCRST_MAG01-01-915, partial [uncultured Rubrobacteraceae bacterium]